LSNNLASLSIKALEFLLAYPYGCAEQIASKIEGLLLVPQLVSAPEQKALRVVYEGESYTVNIGIEQGIERLAKIQNADGGYGFYTGLASNIAVSAHVAEVLARVQSTSAREQRTRVLAYLASAPLKEVNSPFTRDDVPLLSTVYSALAGTNYAARVQALLVEITRHAGGTNIQYIDTATLARLSRVLQTQSPASALTKTAQTELVNRVHIDTRGGYVRDVESAARYPFSTPTSATADSVRALVGSTAYMSDTSHRDGIARLLRSLAGSSQRRSISTVDSLSIARAFADFTRHAQKEGRARGGSATLADASLLSGAFINADKRTTFAAGDLVRNTLVPLVVTREGTGTADMYYDATLTYAIDPTQAPARDEGLSITRALYSLDPAQTEAVTTAKLGEVVRGRMVVTIPSYRDTVLIEDPIPAGFEIVDFALATENETLETLTLKNVQNAQKSGVMSGILGSLFGGATSRNSSNMFFGATLYPSHTEQRDDRVVLFLENTTPGTYHYTYMLRATVPGIFTHLPAHISDSYSPEIFGRSAGAEVKISK
jgi:uncharacterized protein YfaS (alpha-2-macroglobulin family)